MSSRAKIIALAAGLLGLASAGAGAFPVASEVRLGGDAKDTRFVMDLSEKVDIAAFTLADPYRRGHRSAAGRRSSFRPRPARTGAA